MELRQQNNQNDSATVLQKAGLKVKKYVEFSAPVKGDPREVNPAWLSRQLIQIIEVEGPVIAKRACDIYLRAVGIKRMGPEIRSIMSKAIRIGLKEGHIEAETTFSPSDIMGQTLRLTGGDLFIIRSRGSRTLEEIPPQELQFVGQYMARKQNLPKGSEEHLRAILDFFELRRLTAQAKKHILQILQYEMPNIDAAINYILPLK